MRELKPSEKLHLRRSYGDAMVSTPPHIAVVGCPGSGKSTLARSLAEQFNLVHVELDSLYHQPNWTPADLDTFRADLSQAFDDAERGDQGWVSCGNYNTQSDGIHLRRATTVIWLDLPRPTIMRRITKRTFRRMFTQQELWNGNHESPSNLLKWNPENNVIRWAWVHYGRYQKQYQRWTSDGTWDHLTVVHLRSPGEVADLLASSDALL